MVSRIYDIIALGVLNLLPYREKCLHMSETMD